EVIQPRLVVLEAACELLRRGGGVGRADGLVRLLRGLVAAAVDVGLVRKVRPTEGFTDVRPRHANRITGEHGAVGTHVGDVAVLIERLRGAHRALRTKPKPRAGGLLQGAGDERRAGAGGR